MARSLLSKIATSLSKPNAESFSAIENLYVLFGRQKHRLLIRPIAGTLELA